MIALVYASTACAHGGEESRAPRRPRGPQELLSPERGLQASSRMGWMCSYCQSSTQLESGGAASAVVEKTHLDEGAQSEQLVSLLSVLLCAFCGRLSFLRRWEAIGALAQACKSL